MNKIYVDSECSMCSQYGTWISSKQKNIKLSTQSQLSNNEIQMDTLIFENDQKKYYFSDAVIESIASIGGMYSTIKILYLGPKKVRNFIYTLISKNRHRFFKVD